MTICTICGKKYVYIRTKGCTTKKCASCMVNQRRFMIKEKMVEFGGGKCFACGYDKCSQALCFHHLDPSTKKFNLSGAHSRSWAVIEEELKKCVMLCMNCHTEHHAGKLDLIL